jgi:hypothetical protein
MILFNNLCGLSWELITQMFGACYTYSLSFCYCTSPYTDVRPESVCTSTHTDYDMYEDLNLAHEYQQTGASLICSLFISFLVAAVNDDHVRRKTAFS